MRATTPPNATIKVNTQPQTDRGADLSWIGYGGQFANGKQIKAGGMNFEIQSKYHSPAHYCVTIRVGEVIIRSKDLEGFNMRIRLFLILLTLPLTATKVIGQVEENKTLTAVVVPREDVIQATIYQSECPLKIDYTELHAYLDGGSARLCPPTPRNRPHQLSAPVTSARLLQHHCCYTTLKNGNCSTNNALRSLSRPQRSASVFRTRRRCELA